MIPEQNPCRRNPWSRSCPAGAGGWDPASSLPSFLFPFLPRLFLPPFLRSSPRPRRLLSTLVRYHQPPLSFTSFLLHGRGILKRVALHTQSTEFAAWKNRPWMTDRRLSFHQLSPFPRFFLCLYLSLASHRSPSLSRSGHAREQEFVRRWRETKNAREKKGHGVSGRTWVREYGARISEYQTSARIKISPRHPLLLLLSPARFGDMQRSIARPMKRESSPVVRRAER